MTTYDNIIFLDFDGVLNNTASIADGITLLPEKIILLSNIIKHTNSHLVLSSTWRNMFDCRSFEKIFRILGGRHINVCGVTPYLGTGRGYEIQEWLDNNDWNRYIIIDDDTDMMDHQLPYLLKTHEHIGLHLQDIPGAIRCLLEGTHINNAERLERIRIDRAKSWKNIHPSLFA